MATHAEDPEFFLSRWSRRKAQVRQGVSLPEVAEKPAAVPLATKRSQNPVQTGAVPAASSAELDPANATATELVASEPATEPSPEPALTLDDVKALTQDSDFRRFISPGVRPDVKNAALAKLFTDPHFNVMDGLDVYIDDYSKPDPLPPGMLRQMLQSKMLGLFDDEPDAQKAPDDSAQPPVTQYPADENTDLQLQPDDDAGRTGPAPGAGEDTTGTH